jgi:DNA ligase-1
MTKPMLASDWDEAKVKFPVFVQPKIDGVRAMCLDPDKGLTGRSLKQHANVATTRAFSNKLYLGFDGEMVAERETHPDLCRLTTSALSTIEGQPWIQWILFDYITEDTIHDPYRIRMAKLLDHINTKGLNEHPYSSILTLVPNYIANDMQQLLDFDTFFTNQGYEGMILRDPEGKYKQGRSTAREGGLLRIKRFTDGEAVVTAIIEGQRNENAAETNELGLTERSSHQENMVPNGMVGALICKDLKTAQLITVSAGCMVHDDRVKYFNQQGGLIGKTIKYKFFAHGVKDKPRFPTFQGFRAESDIS